MALMSSQRSNFFEPSSSQTPRRKYEVFLSFRGADVRDSFLEYLYRALRQKGILTFKDDDKLEDGNEINDGLMEAIEESRFSIVVLSKNYANSSWCLKELMHILKCKRDDAHIVYPVFFHVSPSDIRRQEGSFGEGFAKACLGKQEEEVKRWRDALEEVGDLKGYHYPHAKFEYISYFFLNALHLTICYNFSKNIFVANKKRVKLT